MSPLFRVDRRVRTRGTDDSYEGGAASLLISGNGSNYDKVTNGRPTFAAKVPWVPGGALPW